MTAGLLYALVVGSHLIAGPVAADACPGGRPEVGDVGIRGLRCDGPAASCAINVRSGEDGKVRHTFAVEPVVTSVGPSAQGLRARDTIVAIEGILITTAAGGERLAQLPIGRAVVLLVRRGEVMLDLRMVTQAGCGISSLRVSR
jgi:hypothetical protein